MPKMADGREVEKIARSLRQHDVKAMKVLRRALSGFVPIAVLPGISQMMAERLVAQGLAEKGKATSPGGSVGYRLSEVGRRALEVRRTLPPTGPGLTMLKPRIPELPHGSLPCRRRSRNGNNRHLDQSVGQAAAVARHLHDTGIC
jgi:DNA-binding HxlR family transcriptional regulator